jgi:regulator of protease activity HflC (stomatin/prohibitin superfamily)
MSTLSPDVKNTDVKTPSGSDHANGFVTDETPVRTTTREERQAARPPRNDNLLTVEPLRNSDMQPRYAQDMGAGTIDYDCYGSMINCLGAFFGTLGSFPPCFCCPNPYKEVRQGSVGLVTRFGKFYKSVDPGLVKVNPFSESLKSVDVKIQVAPIPRQTALTKDNVNLDIDSVVYWHVTNPYKAAFGISDVRQALVERAQTTLRSVVGSRTLQSVVVERETIALEIEEILEAVSDKWGIQVESILIKDIIFSRELQESLSSAAQQKRLGEAKVIAARAEVDAAKLMRAAADILSSPAAIQIRSLEAYQAMARSANSKVIFVPTSMHTMGSQVASQLALDANDTRS